MSFLRRLFGGSARLGALAEPDEPEEPVFESSPAVVAWVKLANRDFTNEREQARVFALENRLIAALDAGSSGRYDTNQLEPGFFGMQMLGDDVDGIIRVVRPLLADAPAGSYLTVRRGPTGTAQERVELGDET